MGGDDECVANMHSPACVGDDIVNMCSLTCSGNDITNLYSLMCISDDSCVLVMTHMY